jgi:hypothetical protein
MPTQTYISSAANRWNAGQGCPTVAWERFHAVAAEFEERCKSLWQGLAVLNHEQIHAPVSRGCRLCICP